jgi:hypothetical protein
MQDSNLRPLGPKPSALPSCANHRHLSKTELNISCFQRMRILPSCVSPVKPFLLKKTRSANFNATWSIVE